jgi:hypothetical protein
LGSKVSSSSPIEAIKSTNRMENQIMKLPAINDIILLLTSTLLVEATELMFRQSLNISPHGSYAFLAGKQ